MKIGLAAYPGCMVSGLFAFAELLEVSNKRSGKRHFDCKWAAVELDPLSLSFGRPSANVLVTPEVTLLDPSLDAILLPGYWTKSSTESELAIRFHNELISMLASVDQDTAIWAYCTSVGLLAQTGKLSGQEATGTWWLADYLQSSFTDVNWRFGKTCIFQGQNATASGVNGYLPIAQQLIREKCGKEILRDVIDVMVIPRPESELHPFQAINLMKLDDAVMQKTFLWVEKTPATELTVTALAKHLILTERTLARKVKSLTGQSCASFMKLVKLNQAGDMLIYGIDSINKISEQLGYSDDASFRRVFKNVTAYTPSQFRQQFMR